jgi:peptide/nickel transport system permease protein
MNYQAPLVLLFILTAITLVGITGDYTFIQVENILAPPNTDYIFGTDELGRDILPRLAHGILISVFVGISVLVLSATIGVTVGIISGWYGGIVDNVLMRITDIFLSFPGILIAICFAALSGPGVKNVILALGLMGWVSFARLTRIQTLALKKEEFIQAAVLSGVKKMRIWYRYILPNITAALIVEAIFTVAGSIIAEAGLSFLGIGIQPPEPSLGSMLREGTRYMLVAPHLVFIPGTTLMLIVLMLSFLGNLIRDKLDIRQT